MSTIEILSLTLIALPLSIIFTAYLTRWIASFFFASREAELVGFTCAVASMFNSGFRLGSMYFIPLVIIGWAIGIYLLHKLWRPSRGVGIGTADNG